MYAIRSYYAIVVAINKIDKPNALPDRVKQQLTEHELVHPDESPDDRPLPYLDMPRQRGGVRHDP